MNYARPELRRALAAEYALGTLSGLARRRFERLCSSADGRACELERRHWERRLAVLALSLKPVTPPETAWIGLQRRLHGGTTRAVPLQRPRTAATRSPLLLRAWAWLATAAAVVLAVALALVMTRPPPLSYVAFLQVPKSSMHWTVSLSAYSHRLEVAAAGKPPQAVNGKDAELWWIGADGKPVALGVLPKSGDLGRSLPASLPIGPGGTLAVSIEPLGGSRTGQPTGPVILTAPVARRS